MSLFSRTIPIGRLYASDTQAQEAVSQLRESGFDYNEHSIKKVSPPSDGQNLSVSDLMYKIVGHVPDGHIHKGQAAHWADSICEGRTLVTVVAPFGEGKLAQHILEECDPLPDVDYDSLTGKRAAPLSTMLGIPVLSKSQTFFGDVELTDFTISRMFGMKLLSTKPIGNSSFGLPLLNNFRLTSNPLSRRRHFLVSSRD